MIKFMQAIVNAVWARWFSPIRVVERQMDGCMAAYICREDYGTVIGYAMRPLPSEGKSHHWLIRFDGERRDEWYPKSFFSYQDDNGLWVRDC